MIMKRRAKANPSLTVEQWLMITGGIAAVGIGAYFVFRKPAAAASDTAGANAPLPPNTPSGIADDSAFLQTSTTQAAIQATQPNTPPPGGSVFGSFDPNAASTYNRNGATNLGDPNDPNSTAGACVLAHQYGAQVAAGNNDPGLIRTANALRDKCFAGGGTLW
jgi:hypothetical protein